MSEDPSWEKAKRDQRAAKRRQNREAVAGWFFVVMGCIAAAIVTLVVCFMAQLWIEKTQQEIKTGAKAMSEGKCRIDTLPVDSPEVEAMRRANQAVEQAMVCRLSDGTEAWCLHAPLGTPNEEMTKVFNEVKLLDDPADWKAIEGWAVTPLIIRPLNATPSVNGPYFTWDIQTIPPRREFHPDHDGPYPVVQVHNSQSPGLKKQGRLIRPVTKPDAELAIWEVDIEGEVVVVHDPEEAWMGAGQ